MVVWLSWLSGRALAAQASGVLCSTPATASVFTSIFTLIHALCTQHFIVNVHCMQPCLRQLANLRLQLSSIGIHVASYEHA